MDPLDAKGGGFMFAMYNIPGVMADGETELSRSISWCLNLSRKLKGSDPLEFAFGRGVTSSKFPPWVRGLKY